MSKTKPQWSPVTVIYADWANFGHPCFSEDSQVWSGYSFGDLQPGERRRLQFRQYVNGLFDPPYPATVDYVTMCRQAESGVGSGNCAMFVTAAADKGTRLKDLELHVMGDNPDSLHANGIPADSAGVEFNGSLQVALSPRRAWDPCQPGTEHPGSLWTTYTMDGAGARYNVEIVNTSKKTQHASIGILVRPCDCLDEGLFAPEWRGMTQYVLDELAREGAS